jgi:glycosyltransferase involved in cell wall biosynthesis
MGNLMGALPHYAAAKHCISPSANGNKYAGPLYHFNSNYGELPSLQIAKILFNSGKLEEARKEAQDCFENFKTQEAKTIVDEIDRLKGLTSLELNQEQTDDIVFTCPPQSAYPFDEKLYKEKGMGGSETALIEVATRLKRLTGRNVKCFLSREGLEDFTGESGVEWLSNKNIMNYFNKYKPKVHIAWRHNIKLTNAYTYLWCHDLLTRTVEVERNFDKILCLTEFHKNYVMAMQGVPEDKVIVTRNGINPEKFKFDKKQKNPNKLLWMSSPDRGLVEAMLVCDEVKNTFPDIELHVYYGIEKLDMWGMTELRLKLEKMFSERPYVKYHGFTEQNKMYKEVSDGVVWCHPCNFIETFCITAIEMLALGVYPVTRRLGALSNTLANAESKGQATMLDHACDTVSQRHEYAKEIIKVLQEKKWENVSLDIESHSWENVSLEWKELMGL